MTADRPGRSGRSDRSGHWAHSHLSDRPADGPVWGIVLAAGGGTRFGRPKQFLDLAGVSLLQRSVRTLEHRCDGLVVALPEGAETTSGRRPLVTVSGGAERADSVRSALAAVPTQAAVIVVADAAHPLASPALLDAVVDAVLAGADGALPGLPLTEVLADVDADGTRVAGLPRTPADPGRTRVLVQTPQAFRATAFRRAHAAGRSTAEDSALVADAGGRIVVVPGEPTNVRVTTPAELDLAHLIAAATPIDGEAGRTYRRIDDPDRAARSPEGR